MPPPPPPNEEEESHEAEALQSKTQKAHMLSTVLTNMLSIETDLSTQPLLVCTAMLVHAQNSNQTAVPLRTTMSEGTQQTDSRPMPPGGKVVGRPFVKGAPSPNPGGRPRVEPRVRRYARRYDRKMCRALAEIASDPKVPASERRRAAMDLIAVGSGRPSVVQEVLGRDMPAGPLVSVNMFNGTEALPPDVAYRMMVQGSIPIDTEHFGTARRAPIDMEASQPTGVAEVGSQDASDGLARDSRVQPIDSEVRQTWEALGK